MTGASSGIGEKVVELLGEFAIPTVIVARREDRLEAIAQRFPACEVLVADLTDADDLDAVAARVADAERPVDLVVNNAGFGSSGTFWELDAGRLQDEVATNVMALTVLARAALAAMVPRGRGYLLNLSSVAGFQPAPGLAVYAATKAYVTNLTEALHEETRGTGVHVTALCPGLTRTEFQSVSNTESYQQQIPGVAWLDARAVAEAGLRDVVRGKALSVPGVMYKGLVATSQITPNAIARRLGGLVAKRRF